MSFSQNTIEKKVGFYRNFSDFSPLLSYSKQQKYKCSDSLTVNDFSTDSIELFNNKIHRICSDCQEALHNFKLN